MSERSDRIAEFGWREHGVIDDEVKMVPVGLPAGLGHRERADELLLRKADPGTSLLAWLNRFDFEVRTNDRQRQGGNPAPLPRSATLAPREGTAQTQ